MAGKGGYQPPASPAPASGPGSLSRRTDGQVQAVPTGLPYGDATDLANQEGAAAMSGTPNVPSPSPSQITGAAPAPAPFDRPSERPDEPITQGADIGPGADSSILPIQHQPMAAQPGPMTVLLGGLSPRDATGVLAQLYQSAQSQGV
jgi:hypothetical protein